MSRQEADEVMIPERAGRRGIWRWALLLPLAAYWTGLFVLTHLPPQQLPQTGVSDKLAHFLAYGLLGGGLYLTWWWINPRRRWLWLIVIGVGLSYGALDEWTQALVGRSCELADWLCDVGGVALAVGWLGAFRWAIRK